jgi:hypothetical protein
MGKKILHIKANNIKLIIVTVFVALFFNAYSQLSDKNVVESTFSYQAILRDSDGLVVSNKDVNLIIYIYHKTEGSVPVYKEEHNLVTNSYGLIDIEIGGGTSSTGKLSDIDWSDGPYFLEVLVNDKVLRFNKILAVPFANYANVANTFLYGDYYALENIPDLQDFVTKIQITEMVGGIPVSPFAPLDAEQGQIYYNSTDNKVYSFDGTSWKLLAASDSELFGTIFSDMLASDNSAGDNKITNLAEPVEDTDAATKKYVDTKIEFSGSATYTSDEHPGSPTLGYVYMNTTDKRLYYWNGLEWLPIGASALSLKSMLANNPSAGSINITNVKDPVEDQDGVTRAYVDKRINDYIGSVDAGTLPSSGDVGDIYLNTSDNLLYYYNGTRWQSINVSSNTLDNILSANPNAGSQTITNLGSPTASNDAATKKYVDDKVEDRRSDIYTGTNPAAGESGDIYFNTNDAMLYFYNGDMWLPLRSNVLQLSEMLSISNDAKDNLITNLGAPSDNSDAATKKYVDDKVVEASGTTQTGSSLPAGSQAGDVFYNTTDAKLYYYNGTTWVAIQESGTETLATTLTIDNSAGFNKITNIPDVAPASQAADAVNRKYVMEQLSPPADQPIVKQLSFTIAFDGNWNGEVVPLWRTPRSSRITVKEVSVYAIGSMSPSLKFTIEKRAYNKLGDSGTAFFNESTAQMSGTDIVESGFISGTNTDIDPKTHIVFVTPENAAVSGLVDCMTIIILYTESPN